ncbi:hypothetical protein PG999_010628 [Apiospora kogelbergensis]|uniref:NmrA-like domain-containing protein n=1 Tax=Apiospora kogelbergensis TaxID=1337665 RepID=A0AAW0QDG3_9PEZI
MSASESTTTTPKTIVVVGATGFQGSSVVQTFLALRPHWHVRALTRDTTSAAAQKLAAAGAEVVCADLEASAAALAPAFAGAHAVFLNTDFWAPYRTALAAGESQDAASRIGFETEMRHARNAVAAAAAASPNCLERVVYSALAPLREASGGKYTHSYHWDSKAAVAAWIASSASGVADKASYIYIGAYSTNPLVIPKRGDGDDVYEVFLTAGRGMRMPVLDVETSAGPFVRCLVEDEAAKTNLLAYDEYLDVDGLMRAWTEAVSATADDSSSPHLQPRFVQMDLHEMNRATGLPLEVLEAPPFIEEFGYMGGVGSFVEPQQLRNKPHTRAFVDILKSHGRDYFMGAQLPTAATI